MRKSLSLHGQRFGRLAIGKIVERPGTEQGERFSPMYSCRCDCGEVEIKSGYWLRRTGDKAACRYCTQHGDYRETPLFRIWTGLRSRCFNPKDAWHKVDLRVYGAQSVTMNAEWAKSFAAFRRDVEQRPSGTVIDRRNRAEGWTKDNTVWRAVKEFIAANESECASNSCEAYLARAARAAA